MTGPYVVRHLPACTCDGIHADASCPRWADDRGAVFLQAFETLEEARAEAARLVRKAGRQWSEELAEPYAAAHSLPAEGGKVDLPDGSTITVEATTWVLLEDAILTADPDAKGRSIPILPAQMWSDSGRSAALIAWNAEHAIGGERR